MNINTLYWKLIREKAKELGSDGCSGVADAYLDCCRLHDIFYRTKLDWKVDLDTSTLVPNGPIGFWEANWRFKKCIQERGGDENTWWERNLKHPWAWVRFTGVTLFGWPAWFNVKAGRRLRIGVKSRRWIR